MDTPGGTSVRRRRPEAGRSGPSAADLSPDSLLAAVESFCGRWVDLDRGLVVGPDGFARGRADLAQQMRGLGLRGGDRVIVAVGNGPLFPAALAAVLANGGSPLLVHVETPPAELRRVAMHYGVRFMVCDGLAEPDLRPVVRSTAPLLADTWGSAV